MKNILLLSAIAVLISSCQPKVKEAAVDVNAGKTSINEVLDQAYASFKAKEFNTYLGLLTDDALVCGTDPGEFWSKAEISQIATQMFADTTIEVNFKIDKREIRVSKDGKSAIVVEQMLADLVSPKIPMRRVFHLVKNNDTWQIDFDCSAMIPRNEDLPKINTALKE